MDIRKYIKMSLTAREISQAELARRLGMLPQSLNAKMNIRSFNVEELEKVADALGCDLSLRFIDRATGKPLF